MFNLQKVLRKRYQSSTILIRRKVNDYLLSLLFIFSGTSIYFFYVLFSKSSYKNDLKFILVILVFLLIAIFLLCLGHFKWSSNLILLIGLFSTSAIVYFGYTLNELKMYNMAFLHSIVLIFSVLVAQTKKQIILVGLSSSLLVSLFLYFKLLPQAGDNRVAYISTFIIVTLYIFMETMIGIQILRVINTSLNDILYNSEHDETTNLPNEKSLIRKISGGLKGNGKHYLLFYRVENYMELLLNLGTEDITKTMIKVHKKIKSLHESEVYRTSSDILITISHKSESELLNIVQAVQANFRNTVSIDGMKIMLFIRCSMIECDNKRLDIQENINRGLLALYQAKSEKKNFVQFNHSSEIKLKSKLKVLHELANAINARNYKIVYQPIVNKNREIVAIEALSRWTNSSGTAVSPDIFIPMLEQSGLMSEFFIIMVSLVLKDMKEYPFLIEHGPLFINLSPELINHSFDFNTLIELIDLNDIDHSRLGFEITETSFSDDRQKTKELIDFLKKERFQIALDDFGTGYSDLSKILDQSFDKIKFDKTFIDNILSDDKKQDLLLLLTSFFQTHNYAIVVEGVEDQDQFDMLCEIGCHQFQGYLFYKPMSPEKLSR